MPLTPIITLDILGITPSAQARRLRSVFSDYEFDDWVDNLDDRDIDYFYNLMMNGRMGDIMDAFQYDVEYDDYDRYYDYYDDMEALSQPNPATAPVAPQPPHFDSYPETSAETPVFYHIKKLPNTDRQIPELPNNIQQIKAEGIYEYMRGVVSIIRTDPQRHICSGSLIGTKYVLSAAHCFVQSTEGGDVVKPHTDLDKIRVEYGVKKGNHNQNGQLKVSREVSRIFAGSDTWATEDRDDGLIYDWAVVELKFSAPNAL